VNAPAHPSPDQKVILIVDDLEENRTLLERALKSSGYGTISAESGAQALSMISRQAPDLVLLDWMMPQLSGLDTLRAIRERYPSSRLPVIMCTAIGEEMSVVAAINAGATDYMTKPISLPILRARMSVHLQQSAVIDALGTDKANAERRLDEHTRAILSGTIHSSGFGDAAK
jgi:DNA-binding response OmpR family regulator